MHALHSPCPAADQAPTSAGVATAPTALQAAVPAASERAPATGAVSAAPAAAIGAEAAVTQAVATGAEAAVSAPTAAAEALEAVVAAVQGQQPVPTSDHTVAHYGDIEGAAMAARINAQLPPEVSKMSYFLFLSLSCLHLWQESLQHNHHPPRCHQGMQQQQ